MRFHPATQALARLDAFAGEWETTGVMATGETFRATDTYEWVAGGHFLLHRFDAEMPAGPMQACRSSGRFLNVLPENASGRMVMACSVIVRFGATS